MSNFVYIAKHVIWHVSFCALGKYMFYQESNCDLAKNCNFANVNFYIQLNMQFRPKHDCKTLVFVFEQMACSRSPLQQVKLQLHSLPAVVC